MLVLRGAKVNDDLLSPTGRRFSSIWGIFAQVAPRGGVGGAFDVTVVECGVGLFVGDTEGSGGVGLVIVSMCCTTW
jgi:hypothetical protein